MGFRTAELRTDPDRYGNEFTLMINDEPVYVKGANWIPDDALLTRFDAGALPTRRSSRRSTPG